jgi:hypothetical protein
MVTIGCRGRLCGAARCAESREQRESIGGGSVWSRLVLVQSGHDRIQARPGGYGTPRCKVGVATRRRHHALQSCVQCEARWCAGARERAARSARAGRHGGVGTAWPGWGARSGSWSSASGNRFVMSKQAWRRGDKAGDGRWHAGPAGVPTVGMAMARAAWGFDTESLRGGAGARVPAGWRSSTGGRGRRLVEEQREKEGF